MAQYVPAFRPGDTVTFDVTTAVVAGRYVELGSADRAVAPAGAGSLKVIGVAAHDAAIGDKVTVEISKAIDLATCADAITRGALVGTAAAGKVTTVAPLNQAAGALTGANVMTLEGVIGLALNTTTAGDQSVYVLRF